MPNVQTFRARSMPEALERVKHELGADAVILGTRRVPAVGGSGQAGPGRVEITAAPPDTTTHAPRIAATPANDRRPPSLPEDVYPYYLQLVQNEVSADLAARLVREAAAAGRGANRQQVRERVRAALARLIPASAGIELTAGSPRRVALVGPAGGGKTTTLAKLAAQFKLRQRSSVAILSLDMHRMATNEQLQRYAELIGVPMHSVQTVAAARELSARMEPVDLLLIDTPGVGLQDHGRFVRMAALLRALRPQEVHLVLQASLARAALQRAAQMFAPLGVSQVVLTRLDEVVGLGVVLDAVDKMGWTLSYLADGQNVPKNIEKACSRRVAELILPSAE